MMHATTTGFLDTRAVCARLGVSPALLRLWESRYGWPSPRRTATGQRRFSAVEVTELRQVLNLVRSGRAIGSLLTQGRPVLPQVAAAPRVLIGETELAGCPEPETEQGQQLREHLVTALRRRDTGAALAYCHEALRVCRPAERAAAVWEPVLVMCQAWEAAGRPLPAAERLRDLVDQALSASTAAA